MELVEQIAPGSRMDSAGAARGTLASAGRHDELIHIQVM